tara:strand:+ start:1159 stop:1440 length:282 start_codon:yes stop_codon:yes gene_type:complete
MKKFFINKIIEKILYWLIAIVILIAVPCFTILILRLGVVFYPLGLLIKIGLYLFCGGLTVVGFTAMILFFYESIVLKDKKNNKASKIFRNKGR